MLDIKRIRQNPQELIDALKARNKDISLDTFLKEDEERRALMAEVEEKKALRNQTSKKIGLAKKNGASEEETAAIMREMRELGDVIDALDEKINELDAKMQQFLMSVPNIPNPRVPIGKDDSENVEVRRWGTPRQFGWEPKAHWDIGTDLKILDFDTAAKISGARFTIYRGLGSRLERSIINFFLNTHVDAGYDEVYPPYMVTRATMTGTGQLPKFEDDAYKVDQDTFLIPTAEVPVTNMYRDMILDGAQLPIRHCAYSSLLPRRGRQRRPRHPRSDPSAPVQQGGNGEDRQARRELRRAGKHDRRSRKGAAAAGSALPRGEPVHRRSGLQRRPDLRHRSVDALLRPLCGNFQLLRL